MTDDRQTRLEIAARPALDAGGAARLADDLFGATGTVRELGSQQDRNFRVDTADGPRVLKVANRGWGRAAIDAQNAALLHVAAATSASPRRSRCPHATARCCSRSMSPASCSLCAC